MKTLLVTSCNRIKQTALAILINSFLIKEKFNLVIADSSTPQLSKENGLELHRRNDTYNYILDYNYCPDIEIFDELILNIPNINEYKIIHVSPSMTKEIGETTLIYMGLTMANLIRGARICLKLSGTCVMYEDIWTMLSDNFDILSFDYHRSWFSTRVFGCKVNPLLSAISKEGFSWIDNKEKFVEEKFTEISKKNNLSIKHSGMPESKAVSRSGSPRQEERQRIEKFIKDRNIKINHLIMDEFYWGGIW